MSTENFDIDSMADDALTPIAVDVRVSEAPRTYPGEPAVRLAAAQKRVRDYRSDPSVWPNYDENFYRDFCGEHTSESEFEIWRSLGALLHTQPYFQLGGISYDRHKAEGLFFVEGQRFRVPLHILKANVEKRIVELGVKDYLIFEYMAEEHTVAEDRGFYAQSFEDRIAQFKA